MAGAGNGSDNGTALAEGDAMKRLRVGATVAILLLALHVLPAGIRTAYAGAGEPATWPCSSARLGLDEDRVELAPIVTRERAADGGKIQALPARGQWVPVIMVHGWTGRSTHPNTDGTDATIGAFSHSIDLTANQLGTADVPRSLIGQLQGIPGAAVFTFDYHPYSGRWVTDPHLGPALGKVIDCLAKASGQKVIVVGHSMGGLVARYASAHPDRSASISRIITLGTPNTGSLAALLADRALTAGSALARPIAVLRLVLAVCGQVTTAAMNATGLCASLPPFVAALDGQAGRALRAGSPELKRLSPVPAGIKVDALAGDSAFQLPLSWFGVGPQTEPVRVGDLIVPLSSALSRSRTQKTVACTYQLSAVRGASQQMALLVRLKAANEVAQSPLTATSGPCFHGMLMRSIELTNEVMGLVDEDINPAPTAAELLRATIPGRSCGLGDKGWNVPVSIRLSRGMGSAKNADGSFAGASIMEISELGRADFTGDGTPEVVVRLLCSGSEPAHCCAGQGSVLNAIAVFEVQRNGSFRRIAPPIVGGKTGPGNEFGPAENYIEKARLSGTTIVTTEHLLYSHGYTSAQVGGNPNRAIVIRYRLRNAAWVATR